MKFSLSKIPCFLIILAKERSAAIITFEVLLNIFSIIADKAFPISLSVNGRAIS